MYGHSHEAVLKLLLERKWADVPPSRAVRGGYKAVMKLLLKKGARETSTLEKAEKALLIIAYGLALN